MVIRDASKKDPVQPSLCEGQEALRLSMRCLTLVNFQSKSLSSLFLRFWSSLYKITECFKLYFFPITTCLLFSNLPCYIHILFLPWCLVSYHLLWNQEYVICMVVLLRLDQKSTRKEQGKDGKTMFRILPCASSVINPDSQAILCPTVAGLLVP